VVDPQRDFVHDRQRSKSLGQATQFNGRQSRHSLLSCAHSFRHDQLHAFGLKLIARETGPTLRNTRAPSPAAYLSPDQYKQNEGMPKSLQARSGGHHFAALVDRRTNPTKRD
jgi:hypothetical protein